MFQKPSALTWYIIFIVLGALLVLTLPPNPTTLQTLHISSTIYRFAVASLILPYAIIWFCAFYAYDKLQAYAKRISESHEGKAFGDIGTGMQVLAWGLAIPTILTFVFGAITYVFPNFEGANRVIIEYLDIAVPLISFTFLSSGTRNLNEYVKTRPSILGSRLLIMLFIAIGVFFTQLVIHNYFVHHNPYHLPLLPLLLTIVMPYLYVWIIGITSANELWLYAKKIKGVLYKQALYVLAVGITIVIADSISVQYLQNVYSTGGDPTLGITLVLIYALLAVQAAGFALVALGAKRLMRIEEV